MCWKEYGQSVQSRYNLIYVPYTIVLLYTLLSRLCNFHLGPFHNHEQYISSILVLPLKKYNTIQNNSKNKYYSLIAHDTVLPRNYQLSKSIVHEIKFGDIAVIYILKDFKNATLTSLYFFQNTVVCKIPLLRWCQHKLASSANTSLNCTTKLDDVICSAWI